MLLKHSQTTNKGLPMDDIRTDTIVKQLQRHAVESNNFLNIAPEVAARWAEHIAVLGRVARGAKELVRHSPLDGTSRAFDDAYDSLRQDLGALTVK